MSRPEFQLIEDARSLDDFISSIARDDVIAVDTEFFRETTYYPRLGLVQVAGSDAIACIDPLAFDSREGLERLLGDPDQTKLFHSCSQDFEVLLHFTGNLPCPVIDTQIAAALLGERDQISYANIVMDLLGVELEKSQTRTNWLRRPLSAKQLEYAAEDVLYLIPVYEELMARLSGDQKLDWLLEDSRTLCMDTQRFEPDIDGCWLRVKGTQKLKGIELAIVETLARWREHRAMSMDLTRRQVISDDFIVSCAIEKPETTAKIPRSGKIHPRLRGDELEDMVSHITDALASDPDGWPRHPRFRQTAEQKSRIRSMMQMIEDRANSLGVSQATLGSRKQIERLLDGRQDVDLLRGWRRKVIGEDLLACLG